MEEAQFERLGMFTYSQEDHTPAGAMLDQISAQVKKQRYRRAMALQQRVSREVHERLVGKTLRVLIEKTSKQGFSGRSHADAPEIDGSVLVRGSAVVGEFADVEITAAREYDLEGRSMVGVPA
jgi:ribosomal protein S12 methylthiotransferase